MRVHDFKERLHFSEGIELNRTIRMTILEAIPAATDIRDATVCDDKSGTDLWVIRKGKLRTLSVDLKHRSYCPIAKFGTDDACIETCSVVRNNRCQRTGWTRDVTKRTDFIVYTWPSGNEKLRFWIVPFPLLLAATIRSLRTMDGYLCWQGASGETYRPKFAKNRGYLTASVYPTRKDIRAAIESISAGIA